MKPSKSDGVYRLVVKSIEDSIWLREVVFEGTYDDLVSKYGTKAENPLKPFVKKGKKYTYYFSWRIDYWWCSIDDPRPKK